MNNKIDAWVIDHADIYKRHGGKTYRRETVNCLKRILLDIVIHESAVHSPGQIGRRQVVGYWHRHAKLSAETLRRHEKALRLLWEWLGRPGEPPRPPKNCENLPKKGGG